jgi:hypothetical protein
VKGAAPRGFSGLAEIDLIYALDFEIRINSTTTCK